MIETLRFVADDEYCLHNTHPCTRKLKASALFLSNTLLGRIVILQT